MPDEIKPAVSDLITRITEEIRAAEYAPPFDHPQYIEGTLYVTRAQWRELAKTFKPPELVWPQDGGVLSCIGIPVRIVEASEQVALPSGKHLVWSGVLTDQFIIFDPAVLAPPRWVPTLKGLTRD